MTAYKDDVYTAYYKVTILCTIFSLTVPKIKS
jgi:hypothetical protein